MQKHNSSKPGTPCFVPSKTIITSWLKSLFADMPLSAKIEDFGDGVVYCRLLNHFYGNPPHSKITWSPKNQYQYANNLKHVQTALLQLGITIPFDVNRVSKRKFLQNWALINSFYKHFNSVEQLHPQVPQQNSVSSHGVPVYHAIHNNNIQITHVPAINQTGYFSGTQSGRIQPSKLIKRVNTTANSYTETDQMPQTRPITQLNHFSSLPQQNLWEQHNFANLAQNTLQMTHFLKQNVNIYNSSPNKGKWSVGSQMFQNNYHAVIDRVKQILLKGSHDTEKIKQIKMLLGMPLDQEEIIKIQDDVDLSHVVYSQKEDKTEKVQSKQDCKLQHKQQKDKDCKQLTEMIQRQYSNNKQAKMSVSKSLKKPFKI